MEYGLQMYSVRDLTGTDLDGALRQVAELGYKFVEFAGFFGNGAKEVRNMLDAYGLAVSGTHTAWQELTPDRLAETVRYHHAIGNTDIIIPGADFSTRENLDSLIALINQVQPVLASEGIRLGFHNHSREFIPTPYGAMIHAELEAKTNVDFEIDTYWAYVAKLNPVELLERLRDRIHVIHLKDGFEDGHGMALGEGTAPVAAVRRYAIDHNVRMVVESETCQPTGIEEVGRCIRYLHGLDAQ